MFLMDLRRPSISRRVAKLAALGGAVLRYRSAMNPISFDHRTDRVFQACSEEVTLAAVVGNPGHEADIGRNLPGHDSTASSDSRADGTREHCVRVNEEMYDSEVADRGGGESRAGCRSLALLVAGCSGSAKLNLLAPGAALDLKGKASTARHSGSRRTLWPGIPGEQQQGFITLSNSYLKESLGSVEILEIDLDESDQVQTQYYCMFWVETAQPAKMIMSCPRSQGRVAAIIPRHQSYCNYCLRPKSP